MEDIVSSPSQPACHLPLSLDREADKNAKSFKPGLVIFAANGVNGGLGLSFSIMDTTERPITLAHS